MLSWSHVRKWLKSLLYISVVLCTLCQLLVGVAGVTISVMIIIHTTTLHWTNTMKKWKIPKVEQLSYITTEDVSSEPKLTNVNQNISDNTSTVSRFVSLIQIFPANKLNCWFDEWRVTIWNESMHPCIEHCYFFTNKTFNWGKNYQSTVSLEQLRKYQVFIAVVD